MCLAYNAPKATYMGSNLKEKKAPESLAPRLNSLPTNKRLEVERTQLRRILQEFCAESTLNGRLYSFSRLVNCTRSNGKLASVSLRIERVNDFLFLLEADMNLRARFQEAFHAMLGETQAVGLFAE